MASKLESDFQANVLIPKIREAFPGCIIMKNDSSYIQGIPDLTILYHDQWALVEVKANEQASHQPNQDYYIGIADEWSFGDFAYPENADYIVKSLQHFFRS